MILADTSVWIDHLRHGDSELNRLLLEDAVLAHPFVIGELALGNLRQRDEVLRLIQDLESAIQAQASEVLKLIARHHLQGRGIGYIDAHLLASALLTPATLLTRDKRLARIAKELGLAPA